MSSNSKQHHQKSTNSNLYSIITPQKHFDSPNIIPHQHSNPNDSNKEYLKEIQDQIDILEQKLFSNDEPEDFELFQPQHPSQQIPNYENTTEPLINESTYNNKEPNIPQHITIETIHTEESKQEQLQNDDRDQLYQIILRERKDYEELENLRKEQDAKYKEMQFKCKELSIRNQELANTIEILQHEKQEQLSQIKELQNQITILKRERHSNNIQYRTDNLNYKFSNRNQPYNSYYNNIKYK